MMAQLTGRLKELGKFETSLLVFHSDHGIPIDRRAPALRSARHRTSVAAAPGEDDASRQFSRMNDEMDRAIQRVDVSGWRGRENEARYSALLLIKPPASCSSKTAELNTNESLASLLNLRSYIVSVATAVGASCEYPVSQQVDLFHGLVTQENDGKRLTVGKDLVSGRVNHYRVDDQFQWRIMKDVPFRY
jgi:hypothetical protein